MSHKTHTIEVNADVYDMIQQIKTMFVSYTNDDVANRSDGKVVDILAGGFFESMARGETEVGEDCGDGCGCSHDHEGHDHGHHHDKKDKEGCCGGGCGC